MEDIVETKELTYYSDDYKRVAVLLAGSSGSKFWPISNSKTPEPFVCLFDDTTLFQKTYDLVTKQIPKDKVFVVVGEPYKHLVLAQADIDEAHIITEPFMRQTAPALCLALTLLEDTMDDDTLVCVFPVDQLIKNYGEYDQALHTAYKAATEMNALVTIGIEPVVPTPYFGYIQYHEEDTAVQNGAITEELFANGLRKSINFVEKPDEDTAKRFLESGGFVWNSGILIAKKNVLTDAYRRFMSYHYEKFQGLKTLYHQQHLENNGYAGELQKLYKTFNKISIDYGILENANNIYVVKSTFAWYDLNNWSELHRMLTKDAMNNVFEGNVIAFNTYDSIVMSNDKPIAVMGLENIIAINTEDAILICKKSDSHRVQDLVAQLKKNNVPIY